jgi:hypothetical protein
MRASKKTWGIDIKPPLDGPHHVVRYLSRYVHRIAISNSRILAYDGSEVIFRYKDRADGNKTKTLPSVDTSNPATRGRVKSGHHAGVASETG